MNASQLLSYFRSHGGYAVIGTRENLETARRLESTGLVSFQGLKDGNYVYILTHKGYAFASSGNAAPVKVQTPVKAMIFRGLKAAGGAIQSYATGVQDTQSRARSEVSMGVEGSQVYASGELSGMEYDPSSTRVMKAQKGGGRRKKPKHTYVIYQGRKYRST